MAILILIALIVPSVLAYMGVIGWMLAGLASIVVLFAAAWGIDRGRKIGARDPFVDQHHADYLTSRGDEIHQAPAEAFQGPSDRGTPH
jgi:hypothetical protein